MRDVSLTFYKRNIRTNGRGIVITANLVIKTSEREKEKERKRERKREREREREGYY